VDKTRVFEPQLQVRRSASGDRR